MRFLRVWIAKLKPAKLNTWRISSNKNVDFLDGNFPGKKGRGRLPGDYSISDNFNQF